MSSLTRMLAVLDLFEQAAKPLDADTICARLGYSRPTGYRYIAELVRAGLVARLGNSTYGLGPRVIELDYAIRSGDPVLAASAPVMRELVEATGGDSTLASCYGERIVAIHHEAGPEALMLTYGRGRTMPLLRGALSKCLVAHFPRVRQQRIYEAHGKEIKSGGLGEDWPAFRTHLAHIRKAGYATSFGELDAGLMALAVPVFDAEGSVLATVAAVLRKQRFKLIDQARLVALVTDAARRIERGMHASAHPARAAAKAAAPRRKPGV